MRLAGRQGRLAEVLRDFNVGRVHDYVGAPELAKLEDNRRAAHCPPSFRASHRAARLKETDDVLNKRSARERFSDAEPLEFEGYPGMGAGEDGRVGILLDHRLDNLLGRLVKSTPPWMRAAAVVASESFS